MGKWFGTDGIRGTSYEFPLDPETFLRIGYHFGHHLKERDQARVLVARDTRKSGPALVDALRSGLQRAGIHVLDAGVFPTPAAIWVAHHLGVHAAIVTASHNLYPDNGLKLVQVDGRKIDAETEAYLEERMQSSIPSTPVSGATEDYHERALDVYYRLVHAAFPNLEPLPVTVVLDVAHGAAYRVYPEILRRLGFDVEVLHAEPDGENINQGCGAVHPDRLVQYTRTARARRTGSVLGFAYDGDGDRMIGVVPDYGLWDGHQMLAAGALYLHRQDALGARQAVVSTVMANQGLAEFLARYQIDLERTAVGDKYVYERLVQENLNLGAEPSGHLIDRRRSPTGDGLLATLFLLEMRQEAPDVIAEVKEKYRPYPQVLRNIRVPARPPLEDLRNLNRCRALAQARLGPEGRIYMRYSGTEPVLRILVEARDPELAARIAEELGEAVQRDFARMSLPSR